MEKARKEILWKVWGMSENGNPPMIMIKAENLDEALAQARKLDERYCSLQPFDGKLEDMER